ncbi:MAG: LysR family transcriptional regulator [Oleispira antarctica]|uniref:HTH-type transcriptional regulator MetR n=1 Tax=Oleispira antarctica RB-8 TaxID=698738 RepID=R4YT31_OLEAN|nr:LysR family transcriptional regulator [Oleispira antarctica]MBQ0792523.1 LysR family transcriptional regulator [Oleispira antarctica]CCK75439.1 Transcriptional regulator, LysR family [Oleispira antarctica RB-8]|tara:strand:- start:657 stop:1574 length:918 start_codon:yes stop_codon:yes gene_type:complete
MLEIKHLKTVRALRDGGSLVEAAKQLHLTQSALSHQLKDVEERLGLSLFIRKTKPIRFTRAGEHILELAEKVIPQLEQTSRDIKKLAGGQAGRLHMAIECHSCFDWLMPAINSFRDQWPEVEIDLMASFHFEPLPALARGDLDLVVTADPTPMSGIYYQPLFRYQALLAIANQDNLTDKKFVEAKDLAQKTLIHYPVERKRLDIFTQFLDPNGIEPNATRHADLTLMIVQLVASGRGVACLPNWALQPYLNAGLISSRPLGEKGIWPTLYAAIREEQKDSSYMKDFLQQSLHSCNNNLTGIEPLK